eukprot:CAMPEP_0204378012 /NCGR_PEP_ID=MMETSP0469-20131031/51424_1 /ASSEMBLY_ACC=CAM_ASM_000384 /TAXON_ID=2969 /ORGANISM="Oxyrrhis marina" /LENGTH=111 /DNA_ID=CAMNT_0051369219 /DNA_START=105 /DNA_END=436 /DNA_ORIENTATION=+
MPPRRRTYGHIPKPQLRLQNPNPWGSGWSDGARIAGCIRGEVRGIVTTSTGSSAGGADAAVTAANGASGKPPPASAAAAAASLDPVSAASRGDTTTPAAGLVAGCGDETVV